MENKKITEFVRVDESNEEKISTEITIQSFANYQEVQSEKAKVIMERPLDWQ